VAGERVSVRHDPLGLDEFRRISERTLGAEGLPWYVSYRVGIGVK